MKKTVFLKNSEKLKSFAYEKGCNMPKSPHFPPRYHRPGSDRRGSCVFREQPEQTPVFPYPFRAGRGPRVLTPRRRSCRNAGK
jgi:hypothetical protein